MGGSSLDVEDGSLWGIEKAFRSPYFSPTGTALSDTNKTELLAQSLESQFQLNDTQNPHKDEVITNIVDAFLTTNINTTHPLPRSSI
ncbi:hypothetical protein TNCV_4336131 [Trichonephila clavipes]|nr:hypothetical protein TNCV_4336131 [Trichonephila clavipes]